MPTSADEHVVVYLDSSALVKLVIDEPESGALRTWLEGRAVRVSSALATVEVPRAVRADGDAAVARARDVLARVGLLTVDQGLLDTTRDLDPEVLRSLDAIHVASALAFGDALEAVVAYDHRLLDAATTVGLATVSPR